MKKILLIFMAMVIALSTVLSGCSSSGNSVSKDSEVNLNSLSLDELIELAKKDGRVDSVGMLDNWANWGETWGELLSNYGLKHTDKDMSSAEELAVFESEKTNATKDIGDVGQAFGPVAESMGLTLSYKTSYWDDIPDFAKDDDGDWIIAYYGTISIVTNTNLVKNPPRSFADILAGDYKVTVGDVTKASQAQNAVLAAAVANGGSESNIQPGIDFFKKLAEQKRLDLGELTTTRVEKGEVQVALMWDYNSLSLRDICKANNTGVNLEVCIPSDGSIQSGYCTIINAYAKHPYAAALAREYILSDEGQINLAKGYARPIRSSVILPDEVKAKLLPDEQYTKARMIKDAGAWKATAENLGTLWQEEVISAAQ